MYYLEVVLLQNEVQLTRYENHRSSTNNQRGGCTGLEGHRHAKQQRAKEPEYDSVTPDSTISIQAVGIGHGQKRVVVRKMVPQILSVDVASTWMQRVRDVNDWIREIRVPAPKDFLPEREISLTNGDALCIWTPIHHPVHIRHDPVLLWSVRTRKAQTRQDQGCRHANVNHISAQSLI